MATDKNITMKQFNGTDYDTLYPKTIASQIPDVYSKSYIDSILKDRARIQTGSYVGTGTYGASNPCSLTFDFPPKMFCISKRSVYSQNGLNPFGAVVKYNNYDYFTGNTCFGLMFFNNNQLTISYNMGIYAGNNIYCNFSLNDKTLTYYTKCINTNGESSKTQFNDKVDYDWLILG